MMYEKMKSMDYIFGGEKSPTPEGIFMIEKKSPEEYISGYYPERKNVKFFWIYTSGCIRVSQQELDWLVENIELGTTVIM